MENTKGTLRLKKGKCAGESYKTLGKITLREKNRVMGQGEAYNRGMRTRQKITKLSKTLLNKQQRIGRYFCEGFPKKIKRVICGNSGRAWSTTKKSKSHSVAADWLEHSYPTTPSPGCKDGASNGVAVALPQGTALGDLGSKARGTKTKKENCSVRGRKKSLPPS